MEKKNVQEPEWYKDVLNNPSTIQFVDEFVYSYTEDKKKPVRFHYVGNDKVIVVFDDDTRQDYSVAEVEAKFG